MDTTTRAGTPLRQRMIEDMRMRKLGQKTQDAYIRAVRKLTEFLKRSPDTATVEDLRNFQLHLACAIGVVRARCPGTWPAARRRGEGQGTGLQRPWAGRSRGPHLPRCSRRAGARTVDVRGRWTDELLERPPWNGLRGEVPQRPLGVG